MTVVATDSARLSNLVKHEYEPGLGFCREKVTAYEAALTTYKVGTVLGRYLVDGSATSAANAGNTGTGTMGTVTVGALAKKGIYNLRVVATSSGAGTFVVTDPDGKYVGQGTVAVAFNAGGLSFTLADGTPDFALGDGFIITVDGTEKYKVMKATAIDGSANFAGIVIADGAGDAGEFSVAATTDTTVLILKRGPALIGKENLVLDATVNTAAEKAQLYAEMAAVGILANDVV